MKRYLQFVLLVLSLHSQGQDIYNGPIFFRSSGNYSYYIVIDGKKLKVPINVVNRIFKWDGIVSVSDKQMDFLPDGNELSKDAELVQVKGDPDIYFVSNGRKHLITSPDAFNHYGFKWDKINKIKEVELSNYLEGASLYPKSQEQLEFEELEKIMETGNYFNFCYVVRNDGSRDSGFINLRNTNSYDACASHAYFRYNSTGHDRIDKITTESVRELMIHFEATKKSEASSYKYACQDGYFVPVFSEDGPLIIYKNPFPTHIDVNAMRTEKLVDRIYGAVESAAVAMSNKDKMTYQKDGKIDLGKFLSDAGKGTLDELKKDRKEITKTLEMIIKQNNTISREVDQDYSEFKGMEPIWMYEYILEDKETGYRTMVFRDNYAPFLDQVKLQCPEAWDSFKSTHDEPEDYWKWSLDIFKLYNECLGSN